MIKKLKASKTIYEEQKVLNKPFESKVYLKERLEKFKCLSFKDEKIKLELAHNAEILNSALAQIISWKDGLENYCITSYKFETHSIKKVFRLFKA